jgi:toxin ParE1/3/4
MAKARILRSAVRDLDEIWLFIAQNNVDAAQKLIEKIEATCQQLARLPGMGRKRDELAAGLLSFPVGSYLIFYTKTRGGIEVVHVYHGARRIEGLFRAERERDT